MVNFVQITDSSFDAEVLKCDIPVLADFETSWHEACIKLTPCLEEIAIALGEQIKIVKVDIQLSPIATSRYAVLHIPTLILFKNGIPLERLEGVAKQDEFLAMIKDDAP